jgi:hypothetical protein
MPREGEMGFLACREEGEVRVNTKEDRQVRAWVLDSQHHRTCTRPAQSTKRSDSRNLENV